MAFYQAIGSGPVSFLDPNQAQQEIPLSEIYFDANGINASKWPGYTANQALVDALLTQLVAQGLITPGTQSTPAPALTITAAQPGTAGNAITVTLASPDATAGTVTVTVSATETHPELTLAAIADALGTSASTANGLVFLQANNNQMPVDFTGTIGAGPDFNCVVPDATSDAAGAFTLAAANTANDADTQSIKITVAPDPSPADTFTLTASWTKTVPALTLAALEAAATNPFAMLVNFAGPADGPLPEAGTVTLQGGAGATSTSATPATVNVLSA